MPKIARLVAKFQYCWNRRLCNHITFRNSSESNKNIRVRRLYWVQGAVQVSSNVLVLNQQCVRLLRVKEFECWELTSLSFECLSIAVLRSQIVWVSMNVLALWHRDMIASWESNVWVLRVKHFAFWVLIDSQNLWLLLRVYLESQRVWVLRVKSFECWRILVFGYWTSDSFSVASSSFRMLRVHEFEFWKTNNLSVSFVF